MSSPTPPRLAEWLLTVALGEGIVGASIVGDAREEYAHAARRGRLSADIWYWIHALRLIGGYALRGGGQLEMGTILKDIKFGARSVMRMPGSAAISVVVLALGIGLCTFMFSLIYGLYFRGLGLPAEAEVVVVYATNVQQGQDQLGISPHDFADIVERQTSFDALFAVNTGTVNVSGVEDPYRFAGAFATAEMFSVLGIHPMLGRGFTAEDDQPGASPVLVLSYDSWRDVYNLDRDVIGQGVNVNGEPGTIIGVMPEGFEFPFTQEVWVPRRWDLSQLTRGQGGATVWARMRDGVTFEQAELEVASIARQLEQEWPEANEGRGMQLDTPIEANMSSELNLIFGAMMIAVLCVLLVACANVANLLLARSAMRTREAAIRVAMGGGRLRVMLPFFAEALALAVAGAVVGIGIAYVGVDWFDTVTDSSRTGRPYFMQFRVDVPILMFVLGVTVLTALAAGLAPAFQMSRTDVNGVLKDEGRGSSSLHLGRLSKVLVVAEVAFSCALLVGAGLMTKSIINLSNVDYPYHTEGLFTARAGLFAADYPEADQRQRFWEDLLAELRGHPAIERAALTSGLPFQGGGTLAVQLSGVEYAEPADMPQINRVFVSDGFFETMGVEVAGRDFTTTDAMDSDQVAIVNQPFIDDYLDGRDPIGLQFRQGTSDTTAFLTIVGVVPDLHIQGSLPPGFPDFEPAGFYAPIRQADLSFLSLAVLPRNGQAMSITADVRSAVRRLDSNMPIYNVWSQAEVIDRAIWFYRVFGTVFIVFGIAALFMASVGLYGVLSFAVSRRTQEMGIRMALGADGRNVVGLVARQGAGQLAIGLAIGFALAFGVTRLIGILMFNVDPQDPTVFGGVLGVIVLVGLAAAVYPARRATSVDPVVALRSE